MCNNGLCDAVKTATYTIQMKKDQIFPANAMVKGAGSEELDVYVERLD